MGKIIFQRGPEYVPSTDAIGKRQAKRYAEMSERAARYAHADETAKRLSVTD